MYLLKMLINVSMFPVHLDEIFHLDSSKMMVDETYVLMLLLAKGERTSLGFQVLELVKGLPPDLGIE